MNNMIKKEYISPEIEVFLMQTEEMIAQSLVMGGGDNYADPEDGFEELSQKKRKRYAWEQTEEDASGSYWK